MKRSSVWCGLACAAVFVLSGCAHFYKITDPASGHVYYTDKIHDKGHGVINFKDEDSKQQVTLSASEVMQITEDQFKANIHPK